MKDKLMNSLKRRRKRKDRYERLSNESLEKRLAFNAAPVLTVAPPRCVARFYQDDRREQYFDLS